MIAISIILSQTHNTQKKDLWIWLIIYLIDMFFTRFMNWYRYRHNIHDENYNSFPIYKRVNRFHHLFDMAWYAYGAYLVWGEYKGTTDDSLYKMALAMVILETIHYATPFIFIALICICYPCLMRILPIISDATNGASQKEINDLVTKTVDPQFFQDHDESHRTCAICMCDFEMGENVRYLPCKHYYHDKCVDGWLKGHRNCPCCRQDINGITENPV